LGATKPKVQKECGQDDVGNAIDETANSSGANEQARVKMGFTRNC
jgi:hypothetical protein